MESLLSTLSASLHLSASIGPGLKRLLWLGLIGLGIVSGAEAQSYQARRIVRIYEESTNTPHRHEKAGLQKQWAETEAKQKQWETEWTQANEGGRIRQFQKIKEQQTDLESRNSAQASGEIAEAIRRSAQISKAVQKRQEEELAIKNKHQKK